MPIEEINAFRFFPLWIYLAIIIVGIIIWILFLYGYMPFDIVMHSVIYLPLMMVAVLLLPLWHSPVTNLSDELKTNYNLEAPKDLTRGNVFKGKEFIAKTPEGKSKVVKAEKVEKIIEIHIDGELVTP